MPYEILGTLHPLLKDARFRIRYVNFGHHPDAEPSISRYHGLVILGGPMNCDQSDRYHHLTKEISVIQDAIEQGKPVLGICLGAQLIARALGARVSKNDKKEIGWYDLSPTADGEKDPLFSKFGSRQKIFQWHGDMFEIPKNAVHLATSPDCRNQAFRYRSNVYGLQFHLEVDEPMIHRWLHTPAMARELEALGGEELAKRIEEDTHRNIEKSVDLGNQIFGEFIHIFQTPRKRTTLASR